MIRNDDLRWRGGGKGTGYLNFTGQSKTAKDKYANELSSSGGRSIQLSDNFEGKFAKNRTTAEVGLGMMLRVRLVRIR